MNRQGEKAPRSRADRAQQEYGTLWRVMEKKEVWQNIDPDPKTGNPA